MKATVKITLTDLLPNTESFFRIFLSLVPL